MPRVVALVLGLFVCGLQPVASQTASATAKAFLQAHTDKQWQTMAGFVDSTSLHTLRAYAEKVLTDYGIATAPETKARLDSLGLGRALQGLQGALGNASMLSYMFARVPDQAAVRALSDRELMARWFEAKTMEYMAEVGSGMMLKMLVDRPEAQEEFRSSLEKITSLRFGWAVIGAIAEGDSVTHVAYRLVDDLPSETGILTFRKSGGRWYIHFRDPDIQLGTMAGFAMRASQARMTQK